MIQQLNNVITAMHGATGSPKSDIRDAAHEISKIAVDNYEGYLLKSALSMVAAVAQFSEDLGRLYDEPSDVWEAGPAKS